MIAPRERLMTIRRLFRALLIAGAALLLCGVPARLSAQTPSPAPAASAASGDEGASGPAEALEPLRLGIDQIEAALRRDDLSDATLVQHRSSIDPVRGELREIIGTLEHRLGDVDTRLKQIGDPPAAGAPPEEPALAAERSRLHARRTALDGTLKQARLLMLRADDLSERITERRRALFTRELFGRTASAIDPGFWAEAARLAPDTLRGVVLLGSGWLNYVRASASAWTIAAAGATLLALFVCAGLLLRRLELRPLLRKEAETRFTLSLFALLRLIRITLTAPALVAITVLILDAFGLMPPRIMTIGFGLAIATAIASFGRGVAQALFAPQDAGLRLFAIRDDTAQMVAAHLTWAARVLGTIVFINIVQRAVVAPLALTVATSAIFAAAIGIILGHFLFRIGRATSAEDEIGRAGWLRAGGWLLAIGIAAALLTGFVGFAAFLAGRFLAALGAIGALYIVLVFIDALFTDVLTASTPRGRAVANFFGMKPRSIELIGTLLSAAIRVLLVLVVLLPLLGPWGIFAADFFSVVREATFGLRIGDVTISLATIVGAFAILLIGTLVTRAVQRWLNMRFLPRTALDPSLQNSVSTIFGYVGVIAALALALVQLGVDFQKITLLAGALSIGIGFGLQSVVSNFVSGLILLAERPIRVGDIISVKGEEGRVLRIHVRATEIETGERASVIIPNSELITQVVTNRTHTDSFARVTVPVAVAYDSDMEKVRAILTEIATTHPQVMQSPAPTVFLTGFGDSGIKVELGCVVRNIRDGAGVKSDICFAVLERFRAEGIVMPYPQRNIRIEGMDSLEEPAEPKPPAAKKPKAR
jgi:small-conductance mechanosensitive channel